MATLAERQRIHDAQYAKARRAARAILRESGIKDVSMSEVARRVGVAGPGMYRYFSKYAGLIRVLYEDTLDELTDVLHAADGQQPRDDHGARLYATTRALFDWCRENRHEFELVLGHGYREAVGHTDDIRELVAYRLGSAFVPAFYDMWQAGVDYPADAEIPTGLAEELEDYRQYLLAEIPDLAPGFPLGVIRNMMVCWRQIYGILCMSAYDHLSYSFGDFTNTFDDMMRSLLDGIGLSFPSHLASAF